MKLKLPLALLTALAACMVSAQETTETTYLHTQIPEGTIPVYEKAIGTDTEDYTVKIQGNYGTSWHVNAVELTWSQSHAYESGRPINVGSALTESTVNIVTPEGATEKTVVSTGANLFIGCSGWGVTGSETYKPMTGIVNVEKGATLIVGLGQNGDSTASQLNVGAGLSHSEYGHEGILNVNGGEVKAGVVNVACGYEDVKGTLNITDGGTVTAVYTGGNTGLFAVGYYTEANGTVNVSGGSTIKAEYYSMVGYGRAEAEGNLGGAVGILNVSENSSVELGSFLFVGREYGSTGEVSVDGSTLTAGTTYLGYGDSTSGKIAVSNGSTATMGDMYMGYQNGSEAELTVSGGSEVTMGQTLVGYYDGSTGKVTVDGGNLTTGNTWVGGSGNGALVVDNGGQATLEYLNVSGSVTVEDGSSATVNSTLRVGTGATLTVTDGSDAEGNAAQSQLTVAGNLLNYGKVTADLSQGGSVEALGVGNAGTMEVTLAQGAEFIALEVYNEGTMKVTVDNGSSYTAAVVENAGTMNIELNEGAVMEVDTYVNAGDSTITAAKDTRCRIANIDLAGGSMKLDGDGEYDLGGDEGLSSEFYVSGATTSTNIDISAMSGTGSGKVNFTINTKSVFTLNFKPESLVGIGSGEEKSFTLTLVVGNGDFSVDEGTLAALLENAVYNFDTVQTMALALEADVAAGTMTYEVTKANFEMQGTNLIWTGTVKGIPEPSTATLSLLALAGLAARRRRK